MSDAATQQNRRSDALPPAKSLLAREGFSFVFNRAKASFGGAVPLDVTGDGRHVMVMPGFMASDRTTARLRRSLNAGGFVCHEWGLGRNTGIKANIFERMDARFDRIDGADKITLIGWSLGGLIAREYAKHAPHRIERVITLGSPFSGDLRANNAWRAYEFIAGYKIDELPIPVVLPEKPPVPTAAFWSPVDGVVAPASARGAAGEADVQIEMACTHMAFVAHPEPIRQIARLLVAPKW
jgi:hypothetical protein